MGGCYSSLPVKTGAASSLLPIRTSNGAINAQPPISRIPVEVLSLIFKQCDPQVRARLILTHTCQRWRLIAVNDPSLWVNVRIHTRYRKPGGRLDDFLSLLGMQLDRTGNLLLEVEWYAHIDLNDQFFVLSVDMIRVKAPFARWRSLTIWISGQPQADVFDPGDTFTSLEYLSVRYGAKYNVLGDIDCMVTSRLKVLDFEGRENGGEQSALTYFPRSFAHASSLTFNRLYKFLETPCLPANIKNLRLIDRYNHPFPHIQSYELKTCSFVHGKYDLQNMTTMTVWGCMIVRTGHHVLLPMLRELKLGSILIVENSKVEAPALETLHLLDAPRSESMLTTVSLQKPECLLLPKILFIVECNLPVDAIFFLISKSPHLTHVRLQFRDWAEAHGVLVRLFGVKEQANAEWETLCPRLVEVRLDFNWYLWEQTPMEPWSTTPLVVYAAWKGEGTYQALVNT